VSISLNATDIANRIRRFTKAVGAVSPVMPNEIHGDIDLADLTRDPYQSEWNSFVSHQSQVGGAGNLSSIGVVGNAPVTIVYAVTMTPGAAGQSIQILTQRPETSGLGATATSATLAPLNNGGRGSGILAQCQAKLLNFNAAGGPSGQTVDVILVGTATTLFLQFPDPIVLYGPGFNGQQATSGIGDALILTNLSTAAALNVGFYFREFPNFVPT
jgi:hypothetical protein